MVARIRSNLCQYTLLWGETGIEGGSKEKALRGKAAGGCVRECTCRICRVVGPLSSQGLEGSSVSIGCEIRKLWKG